MKRSMTSKSAAAATVSWLKLSNAKWEAKRVKEKVAEDEARWVKKKCRGYDHGLGVHHLR